LPWPQAGQTMRLEGPLIPKPIMNAPAPRRSRPLRLLAAALASCLLLACGGVGSGGSGLPTGGLNTGNPGGAAPFGLAEGTITGFGSVIVDGVRFDDSAVAAPYVIEFDGARQDVALHLGQRVRLELDASGKAVAIEVLPQLHGPVTAAPGGGWLQVAGQWVRVGTQAILADFKQVADIPVDDKDLEVHGTWGYDASRGAVLEATLVRLRALPATGGAASQPVMVAGVVQAVDGRTVTIGTVGGARLTLSEGSSVPPVGTLVSFWVDRAVLTQAQPWPVKGGRRPLVLADGTTMTMSGAISAIDGHLASVQGLKVQLPGSQGVQSDAPQPGAFVKFTVRRVGEQLEVADSKVLPQAAPVGVDIEVRASLSGTNWAQRPLSIKPRNVEMRVPDRVLQASGCAEFGTGTVDVHVKAAPGPLPLTATELTCTKSR
jgi:hypothetical protein